MRRYCCPRTYFYPRPPRGGRLGVIGQYGHRLIFLSTPSARRATAWGKNLCVAHGISIHALREEGDLHCMGLQLFQLYFYPRPPRGGRLVFDLYQTIQADFYPRPPRGGRPEADLEAHDKDAFLSTPSARRATMVRYDTSPGQRFLSTPSARRATRSGCWPPWPP